jgi:aspartate ammonia-lyase
MKKRIEHDLLGSMEVPGNVYWGIHTQRAIENFPISNYKMPERLISALAMVKKACSQTNEELGFIGKEMATAINQACDEIIEGKFSEQFPIDALQGGAGTSTNMNINEVIANRALELMGKEKGSYDIINPIEHVNLHQSTNDVFPTALKVAAIFALRDLSSAVAELQGVFQNKEKEFAHIPTIGRTELQDAVPMTLGCQFSSFADAIARDRWRTFKNEERLRTVNIGGTAIGTGLTAPRTYIFLVIEKLRQITGLGLTRAENIPDQTANLDVFVEVSGMLTANACNLMKIAADLRLLHFLGEINLPPVQAGSSIMPGKVNPVILESVMSVGMKCLANDKMISDIVSRGTLQINEFIPLLAFALLESLEILLNTNKMLAKHISGITANPELCKSKFENNPMIITAFLPHIGYDKSTELIEEFTSSGANNFKEFLTGKLGKELVDSVLSPESLMSLGYRT